MIDRNELANHWHILSVRDGEIRDHVAGTEEGAIRCYAVIASPEAVIVACPKGFGECSEGRFS